jgi:phosphomannomutase
MKHTFSDEIIKACDIRGVYPREFDEEDAFHIGRAFGTLLAREKQKTCIIGYDGRESSVELSRAMQEGLVQCGIDIIDIGLMPTPAVYYAVKKLTADAGVIITASHNPAEYNGVKFVLSDGLFHGRQIEELASISAEGQYFTAHVVGTCSKVDFGSAYVEHLLSALSLPLQHALHIVWDPGNGAGAAVIKQLTDSIPGKHTLICEQVDSRFPHHHPDPSQPRNLMLLSETVQAEGADFGVAFDGDADRIGVVSKSGSILQGDQLMVLFARDFLKRNPGKKVMSEVKASVFFYDEIVRLGGEPIMWKVGHTNQKEKMVQDDIQLAGETSGHIFFADNYGFDDGLYAAVRLIDIYAHTDRSLEDDVVSFPRLFDSGEIRLELPLMERMKLVEDIILALESERREIVTIDGVRVACSDGFWMLRSSNTQPHITIRCEALSQVGLDACLKDLQSHIHAAGCDMEAITVYREKLSVQGL